jgi:hypothetical protein
MAAPSAPTRASASAGGEKGHARVEREKSMEAFQRQNTYGQKEEYMHIFLFSPLSGSHSHAFCLTPYVTVSSQSGMAESQSQSNGG